MIAPKPQGGSDRKRQGWWIETTWGGGACGVPRCFQRPCEPLDSLSGLSVACREGGGGEGCERRGKGQLWR